MTDITALARANVLALTPYQSARKIGGNGTIWLNANEYSVSPNHQDFGLDFNALDIAERLNRYPEPQPSILIERYAKYANLSPAEVLVTRGGDEGIELVMRTFCEDDEAVLFCPPTYGMYAVSSQTLGLSAITIPQIKNGTTFNLDIQAIKTALDTNPKIKVVFACNPNNPTGTLAEELDELLAITKDRAIVVVDEAYIEFSRANTYASRLAHYPHLVIIRTLSKAFGLAGIRCGFVLASEAIIQLLAKVIAPYPIPVPTAIIAEHALSDEGVSIMQKRVEGLIKARDELAQTLSALPNVVSVIPSHANYLLVEFNDGQAVFDKLWEHGMILRNQHSAPLLANCIRMTIGTDTENKKVVDFLATL